MAQPLQLAFSHIDRSSTLDDRILDLISDAKANLASDNLRALYYAHEALILADSHDRDELTLTALHLIIQTMKSAGRAADATRYVVRAIDLADSIRDTDVLTDLVGALGAWAIDVEQTEVTDGPLTVRRHHSSLAWARANIARLERALETVTFPGGDSERPAPLAGYHRPASTIDDPETGLLNALGLAAELLTLEEASAEYAVVQIVLSDVDASMLVEVARRTAQLVADRGLVARNGSAVLTALLPSLTGIAAMAIAEHLRGALSRVTANTAATIGIGVAIKQPGELSRDVLRRVADRADEAGNTAGVSVAG